MKDTSWHALFEPKNKSDWIQKIESDAKGVFSEDQLIQDLGEGIHMHAVHTRQDLVDLPHLDETSVYNRLQWKNSIAWKIGCAIQYNNADALHDMQEAVSWGAECIIIQSNHAQDHAVNERLLKELQAVSAAGDVDIYLKPSPHHKQITLTQSSNIVGDALCELARYFEATKDDPDATLGLLKKLRFITHTGPNFYLEMARLRALRYVLARLVKEHAPRFEGHLNVPILAEVHPATESSATIHDLLVASTTKAMATILGGCTVLTIHPHESLSKEERQEMQRLSINLQHILRHEAHLSHVADASAGSYYVEILTHELIQSAWGYYEQER